jgi:hypothetical protein
VSNAERSGCSTGRSCGIIAAISRETLRRILHEGGASGQTTTTWKASIDPDFMPKMRRVLDLYDHSPDDGRVVSVDEFER